jgi:hypothetical protein
VQNKRSATFAISDYLSFLCQKDIRVVTADTQMVKGWPGKRVEWLFQELPEAPRGFIRWAWHKFLRKFKELHFKVRGHVAWSVLVDGPSACVFMMSQGKHVKNHCGESAYGPPYGFTRAKFAELVRRSAEPPAGCDTGQHARP